MAYIGIVGYISNVAKCEVVKLPVAGPPAITEVAPREFHARFRCKPGREAEEKQKRRRRRRTRRR